MFTHTRSTPLFKPRFCLRQVVLCCVLILGCSWAQASDPVVSVDLSASQSVPSVLKVDLSRHQTSTYDSNSDSVIDSAIDLVSLPQKVMTLNQTDFRYRTPQTETTWGHHSAQLWGQCLVALATGDITSAKARLNDWMTDWEKLPPGDEKSEALQLLGTQLSRLGIVPWADKVYRQWCGVKGQCASGHQWPSSVSAPPWSEDALNQYLADVGSTLALLYQPDNPFHSFSKEPLYPQAQFVALSAWRALIQHDLKAAVNLYQQAQTLSPQDPFVLIALGQAYAQQHNWAQATHTFQQAKLLLSHQHDGLWAYSQTENLLEGYLHVARGELIMAQGHSYKGRTEQMDGYERLGRYPEMINHIQQYHCLTVGPSAHQLWAANMVQQYGLWPDTISRFNLRYFRQPDLKYTAALLNARHHKLTGSVQQTESAYRQLGVLQPNRREGVLGLAEINASSGIMNKEHVTALEKRAWLQGLSDDLLDESRKTSDWIHVLRDIDSEQEGAQLSSWTLAEKQYVGQALRYVFLSKYLLGNTASQLSEKLSVQGLGVSMRLNLHQEMIGFLEREQAELATLKQWHSTLIPPSHWELVHQLITDIHDSNQRNLAQFAYALSSETTAEARMRTVQTLFQISEQKTLTFLLDQHVFKALRALPQQERQRWLFEYELPIEPSEIQQFFISVDNQLMSVMGATVNTTQSSLGYLSKKMPQQTEGLESKALKEASIKRVATQKLRKTMGMPVLSK